MKHKQIIHNNSHLNIDSNSNRGYIISMWYLYVLCALCMVGAVIKCVGEVKGKLYIEVSSKHIASILFLAVGITASACFSNSLKYSFIIIFGLIFGLLGDIFLSVGNSFMNDRVTKRYFDAWGIMSFFFGHICYSVAMLDTGRFIYWLIPFMFILPTIYAILAKKGIVTTGKITIPMMVYFFVLNATLVIAINRVILNNSISAFMTIIASCLFIASDIMLGLKGFAPSMAHKKNLFAYTVILTYYPAQLLYALSIAFL